LTFANYGTRSQLRITVASIEQRVDVEQSTLSRPILKLKRCIGMPIFERSRSGVTTLAGNAFIRRAISMVVTADNMVGAMRAAGQGRLGGLALGHNSSVSAGNLQATLLSWREAHPDVVTCSPSRPLRQTAAFF
jgi:DNA-binding transcriptional LysR family regulator